MSQEKFSSKEIAGIALAAIAGATSLVYCCVILARRYQRNALASKESASQLVVTDPALSVSGSNSQASTIAPDDTPRGSGDIVIEVNTSAESPRRSQQSSGADRDSNAVSSAEGSVELQSLERGSDSGPLNPPQHRIYTDFPTPTESSSGSPFHTPEAKRRHSTSMGENRVGFFSASPPRQSDPQERKLRASPRQLDFKRVGVEREEALKKAQAQVEARIEAQRAAAREAEALATRFAFERMEVSSNRRKAISFEDPVKEFSDEVREARKRFRLLNIQPLGVIAQALSHEVQRIELLENMEEEFESRIGERREKPKELKAASFATNKLELQIEKLKELDKRIGKLEETVIILEGKNELVDPHAEKFIAALALINVDSMDDQGAQTDLAARVGLY